MKKSKLNLSLNKRVASKLNPDQASQIMGGIQAIAASGSMMCLPEPNTTNECPTASKHNLCATQVSCG